MSPQTQLDNFLANPPSIIGNSATASDPRCIAENDATRTPPDPVPNDSTQLKDVQQNMDLKEEDMSLEELEHQLDGKMLLFSASSSVTDDGTAWSWRKARELRNNKTGGGNPCHVNGTNFSGIERTAKTMATKMLALPLSSSSLSDERSSRNERPTECAVCRRAANCCHLGVPSCLGNF